MFVTGHIHGARLFYAAPLSRFLSSQCSERLPRYAPSLSSLLKAAPQTIPMLVWLKIVPDLRLLLLVGCLTSQQQASVSQGRICTDNFTCCHTEIEVADPTFYLTQSQYTDTGPTSPSADPITPGAWQGSHWSANFEVTGMTRPRKKSRLQRDSNPGPTALEADALTTRPTRRSSDLGERSPCSPLLFLSGDQGCNVVIKAVIL